MEVWAHATASEVLALAGTTGPMTRHPAIMGLQQRGPVAQLGARLNGIQKVRGSNPLGSTRLALSESLADRFVLREARGNPVGAAWERRGNLDGIA